MEHGKALGHGAYHFFLQPAVRIQSHHYGCPRIAFAHIRNVKHYPGGDFSEVSHRDCDGDTGILEIMKAYHDCGFS